MKNEGVKKAVLWAIVLLNAFVIFFFSSQDGTASGSLSGGITKGILELFPAYRDLGGGEQARAYGLAQDLLRSGAHWFIFFCLGISTFLLARAYPLKKPFLTALIGCVLYAVWDELYQGFFSVGRACEFVDLLKDWTGSCMGAGLIWLAAKSRRRKGAAPQRHQLK